MSVRDRRVREKLQRERLIVMRALELAEAEGWNAVTTRRLAEAIEYSQPVLYSHFAGKTAIIQAVALEGFAELAGTLRGSRDGAASPESALRALSQAYLDFARTRPALYDAMFTLAELPFTTPERPASLAKAFAELRDALAPFSERDVDSRAELFWSSLHGLALLTRTDRLRSDYAEQRLDLLMRTFEA